MNKEYTMKGVFFLMTMPVLLLCCKKNDSTTIEPCPIGQTTVAGRYVITATKYKANSSAVEQDLYIGLDECKKDDTYELRRDSSVTVGDGTNVCPGPPPPGSITIWYVSADGKKFVLDAEYDIDSYDCTHLVVTQKDYFTPGDSRTVTFTKQ